MDIILLNALFFCFCIILFAIAADVVREIAYFMECRKQKWYSYQINRLNYGYNACVLGLYETGLVIYQGHIIIKQKKLNHEQIVSLNTSIINLEFILNPVFRDLVILNKSKKRYI